MATPDIQNLIERFLQIYGSQTGSTEPTRSEPRYQASKPAYSAAGDGYGSEDSYAPTGGVLNGWSSPSPAVPSWARALIGPGGTPAALIGPRPGSGIRGLPGVPIPSRPEDVVGIPNPHLERLVPDWMRDFWATGTPLPKIVASEISGHGGVDGGSRELEGSPSSQPQFVKREDRSGGLGWYVGAPNPDTRILQRVDDDARDQEVNSPPLAPDDPTDTVDEEACAEEWADARRKCAEGFRGPRGQGPYSIPKGRRGRNYTEDDCARGVVSKICGGNALKEGLSGEQRAKRNNRSAQQKRKG